MILWEVMIELVEEFFKTGKDISKELVNVAKDAISPPKDKGAADPKSNTGLIIACVAIFLFIAFGFLLPHLAPKPVAKLPKSPREAVMIEEAKGTK